MTTDIPGLRPPQHGTLEAYWEQGWEGRIEYAFAPDGGSPQPIFLRPGDHLTIWSPEGTVLWQGTVELVAVRWWERRPPDPVQVWSYEKQRGVRYADWVQWFWQRPPLRATLRSRD
ncbi:MAG: hypothetical protein JNL89_19195 [Rhodanobacteraceae bacterium]|nr:hypothetical protein [Rhodanobacteraceae bacterium]